MYRLLISFQESGTLPWYSEQGSATLASTFSSGSQTERDLSTTDLRGSCTNHHTGTSGSVNIAAGIVALTLQVMRYVGKMFSPYIRIYF